MAKKSVNELDEFFGARAPRLGVVTGGSLSHGLDIRLDPATDIESLAVGRYVVVHGQRRFFCMVTDIGLGNTNNQITLTPPDVQNNAFLKDVYSGTTAFGTLHIRSLCFPLGTERFHFLCPGIHAQEPGEFRIRLEKEISFIVMLLFDTWNASKDRQHVHIKILGRLCGGAFRCQAHEHIAPAEDVFFSPV